ncbi:hypothetical protein [Tritonibacter mobilis]|uniref:hypothetical protein n=1 Tax=Tritonibacter mobilis TaxID=379347 RepID=UPI000E0D5E28|nr:hypothetical protein [Tritonibacter mobilis]
MKFLLEEMLRPASRSIGTLLGGALLGIGATEQLAGQVEVVAASLVLFAADLVASHVQRKRSRV